MFPNLFSALETREKESILIRDPEKGRKRKNWKKET
mgnify:CR=1 FL=1